MSSCWRAADSGGSVSAVGVSSVADTEDDDFSSRVIDSVQHAVGTPAGAPHTFQFASQRHANPSGVGQQRPDDQLDDSSRYRLWELLRYSSRSGPATTIR